MQVVNFYLIVELYLEGILLDFEFDPKDILYFRIDREKTTISTFLFALGFSKEKIIETFYSTNKYYIMKILKVGLRILI